MTGSPPAGRPARRPRARRRSAGWLPKQHGAWAMLTVPFAVGALHAGLTWAHAALAAFWFAGYFSFSAFGIWLKSRWKPRYRPAVLTYTSIAAIAAIILLVTRSDLAIWALAFVVPMGIGLACLFVRKERTILNDTALLVAACLMTLVADAAGGSPQPRWALVASVVCLAYFEGTVFYVKTMIRERGSRGYYAASVVYHALAAVAMIWVSWPLTALFAVLLLRAAALPRHRLAPKTIGLIEVAFSATLAVLLLTA